MKNVIKKNSILSSIAMAVILGTVGCSGGGGGDGTTTTTASTTSGTGLDGILVGSTVCIDTNNNGLCSDETAENQDITDNQGKFTITSTSTGPLLLLGGVDLSTNAPFTGSLSAPSGSSVVTPITSAVQALVKGGASPAAAEASIKTALGIPTGVTLTTFDPFEAINDANATTSANAKAVLASQTQLQMIVHAATSTVAGADANKTIAETMGSVFAEIATTLSTNDENTSLTVAQVTALTKTVANTVYASNPAALVAVKSSAESSATSAVTSADATFSTISTGTEANALANLDNGIVLVNTTLQNELNATVSAQFVKAKDLNSTQLEAITDAQALQEEKEAAIAAAKAAAVKAAADLAAAEGAAQADATNKALYDALLEAKAEAARQAELQRQAEAAATEAAALAAAQEAQLAADEAAAAAKAAADLAAAQAQAAADAAAAALQIAAAEQAAADALLAANLADAQAAAANAELNAARAIGVADINSSVALVGSYLNQANNNLDEILRLDANPLLDFDADLSTMGTDAANAKDSLLTIKSTLDGILTVAISGLNDANATTGLETIQASVIDANNSIQNVAAEVTKSQSALSAALVAINTAKVAVAEALADAARLVEYNRLVGVIDANLTVAMSAVASADANVSAAMAAAVQAELDANATQDIADAYSSISATAALAASGEAAIAVTAAQTAASAALDAQLIVASHKLWAETNSTVSGSIANEDTAAAAAEEAVAQLEIVATQSTLAIAKAAEVAAALSAAKTAKATIEIDAVNTEAVANLSVIELAVTAAVDSNASAAASKAAAQTLAGTIGETGAITLADEAAAAAASANTNTSTAVNALALASSFASSLASDTNVTSVLETASLLEAQVAIAVNAAEAVEAAATVASDKLALLQAYAIESSSTDVGNALISLSGFDPLTSSQTLTELLDEIRTNLATPIADGNKDAILLSAFMDIVDIANTDAITTLIDHNATTNINLDAFSGDADVLYELGTSATLLGGTEVMHAMATKLKAASDTIASSFENGAKVIAYTIPATTTSLEENVSINYDESLAIRSLALSTAAALDLFASYSYGDISYLRIKESVIDSVTYEYIEGEIDPLAMIQQSNFFAMANTSRLATAGSYLSSATDLIIEVNLENLTNADINATDQEEAVKVRAAFDGNGEVVSSEGDIININKLFSATEYLDRNDVIIPTTYLGKSAAAIAEYDKLVALDAEWFDYHLAQCQDYNASRVEPVDTIDYNLVYEDEETVVSIDRDLSIRYSEPTYKETTRVHKWVDYNNGLCTVIEYPNDYSEFYGEFDFEPKSTLLDVIPYINLEVELENYFIGNEIFFVASDGSYANYTFSVSHEVTGSMTLSGQPTTVVPANTYYNLNSSNVHIYYEAGFSLTYTYDKIASRASGMDIYTSVDPVGLPLEVHVYTTQAAMEEDPFYPNN